VAAFLVLALMAKSAWIAVIAIFAMLNCWGGLKHAQVLLRVAKMPRRDGYACPFCHCAPPIGPFWKCRACTNSFDTFQTQSKCPICSASFATTMCLDCHKSHPFDDWVATLATHA
jgi:hypothetical protein